MGMQEAVILSLGSKESEMMTNIRPTQYTCTLQSGAKSEIRLGVGRI